MKKILCVTLCCLFLMAWSTQGAAATTRGTAVANIIEQLTLQQTLGLSFGTFVTGGRSGNVATDGTATGKISVVNPGNPGIFQVNGHSNTEFQITFDNEVTLEGPGDPMTARITGPSLAVLDNKGSTTFQLAGRLNINADQIVGSYQGAYNITVNY